MRYTLTLSTLIQARADLAELWPLIVDALRAGKRLVLSVRSENRTLAQNRLMMSCLTDLSEQVDWFGRKLTKYGWKDFITAHIAGQDVVPNMDGDGFVILGRGKPTSDMTIAEMTEVIDRCHAFGDLRGVKWRRTSLGRNVPDEVAA